jgi:G3E family GTPase
MTRLFLLTGFLGSGKTTLLKKLAPRLGGRLAIIVNDFGRECVDEKLLAGVNARLAGIAGGSIFCTCRLDQFENALSDALSHGPDAVLVETSGLGDPTAIRSVLGLRPEFSQIDYRGCLCLADARNLFKVYDTARVVRKQLNAADLVILTKCDAATEAEIARAKALIGRHAAESDSLEVSFGDLTEAQAGRILAMKAQPRDGFLTAELGLHSLTLRVDPRAGSAEVTAFLGALAPDAYRAKGFLRLADGVFRVDSVGPDVVVAPWDGAADNLLSVLYAYGQQAKKHIGRNGPPWIEVEDAK